MQVVSERKDFLSLSTSGGENLREGGTSRLVFLTPDASEGHGDGQIPGQPLSRDEAPVSAGPLEVRPPPPCPAGSPPALAPRPGVGVDPPRAGCRTCDSLTVTTRRAPPGSGEKRVRTRRGGRGRPQDALIPPAAIHRAARPFAGEQGTQRWFACPSCEATASSLGFLESFHLAVSSSPQDLGRTQSPLCSQSSVGSGPEIASSRLSFLWFERFHVKGRTSKAGAARETLVGNARGWSLNAPRGHKSVLPATVTQRCAGKTDAVPADVGIQGAQAVIQQFLCASWRKKEV
ncbi:uncharacterized protein [Equus przewalskii]|uniref:Uncharacterized protein n=1 Tax=Equus przewalskii TaxID=9798 RepID=A0ABM4L083_EQUPR